MAEAIHCPSCTTRYRLSPERLKPVIRRAQCFSCGGVFPVGDVVQRLLAPTLERAAELAPEPAALPAPQSAPLAAPLHNGTAGFTLDDVAAAHAYEPEPEPEPDKVPTLELSDLDVADAEILEKTLVETPASLPETKAGGAAGGPIPFPPEITETTLSGYTSARDAIEKLFANAPAASTGLKVNREAGNMDMEATMSALETTLRAPAPPAGAPGDNPTASGLTEDDLSGPSSSTMRLSQEDLQAIVASAPAPATVPASASAEPTVALRASDFAGAPEPRPAAQAAPFASPGSQETGAELLRLKIGEDIYGGLTMPQIIAWVEEGRILENHLVARQQSENWLEAHKVPGLRPVFERLRRERSGGAPSLNLGIGEIAPKKSLFGGLFGKN